MSDSEDWRGRGGNGQTTLAGSAKRRGVQARASIAGLVEAEAEAGGPTDAQGTTAAALELADRTHNRTWTPALNEVLARR